MTEIHYVMKLLCKRMERVIQPNAESLHSVVQCTGPETWQPSHPAVKQSIEMLPRHCTSAVSHSQDKFYTSGPKPNFLFCIVLVFFPRIFTLQFQNDYPIHKTQLFRFWPCVIITHVLAYLLSDLYRSTGMLQHWMPTMALQKSSKSAFVRSMSELIVGLFKCPNLWPTWSADWCYAFGDIRIFTLCVNAGSWYWNIPVG